MMGRLKLSFYIVVGSYAALFLILFLMIGKFDGNMVGIWGLILDFILLFAALPFHKLVYFGGRGLMGVQSPEIPGDEHLHHKIHKQYEKNKSVKTPMQRVSERMSLQLQGYPSF